MGHNEPPIGVMQIGKNVPETGSDAWLAGYPFGSPALLIRKTAVAGAGILPDSSPGSSDFDQYRLFISNGSIGDSGGPVLDESGELVGLIQGNLPGPVVDEQQRHSSTYDRSGMLRVNSSKSQRESRKLRQATFLGLQDGQSLSLRTSLRSCKRDCISIKSRPL